MICGDIGSTTSKIIARLQFTFSLGMPNTQVYSKNIPKFQVEMEWGVKKWLLEYKKPQDL